MNTRGFSFCANPLFAGIAASVRRIHRKSAGREVSAQLGPVFWDLAVRSISTQGADVSPWGNRVHKARNVR